MTSIADLTKQVENILNSNQVFRFAFLAKAETVLKELLDSYNTNEL